ncbi:hypothetical protein T4B_14263 [Trichinella pseudospiralis]|uniref:Uncharacterized protein n=1 Tax=Trichinella pseudospiralis TaxID=6337 RepID=A0A0V1IEE7_TRIPS|nr:hypothetical protein T4B_14263 [Trichinella pseudospiralis]
MRFYCDALKAEGELQVCATSTSKPSSIQLAERCQSSQLSPKDRQTRHGQAELNCRSLLSLVNVKPLKIVQTELCFKI